MVLPRGLVERGGTRDNVDQLVGDDGLSGSVVEDGVPVDHVTGVLGGVVHGVSPGADLSGVALSHGGQNLGGEGVLEEVGWELSLGVDLEDVVPGGALDSLGAVDGLHGWLEGQGRHWVVEEDGDLGVALGVYLLQNLGSNQRGLVESGGVLADTVERELNAVRVGSQQLHLDLVADGDDVGVRVLGHLASHGLRELGVDGPAQALVGSDGNGQLLGLLGARSDLARLGDVVELAVGGVDHLRGGLGLLRLGQTRRGNDLHRLSDLLDVFDRLETQLDLLQGGVAPRGGGRRAHSGAGGGAKQVSGQHGGWSMWGECSESVVAVQSGPCCPFSGGGKFTSIPWEDGVLVYGRARTNFAGAEMLASDWLGRGSRGGGG